MSLGECSGLPGRWGSLSCLQLPVLRTLGSSVASFCPLDTVPTAVFTSPTVPTVKPHFSQPLPALLHLCIVFSSAGLGAQILKSFRLVPGGAPMPCARDCRKGPFPTCPVSLGSTLPSHPPPKDSHFLPAEEQLKSKRPLAQFYFQPCKVPSTNTHTRAHTPAELCAPHISAS